VSSPSTPSASTADDVARLPFPRLSARTMRFSLGAPTSWTIAPDGATVLFLRSRSGTERTGLLWRLDVSSGAETLVADPLDVLGSDDEDLPVAERARRERMRQGGAGITAYSTDELVEHAALTLSGRLFVLELATGAVAEVPVTGAAIDPQLSPDGRWVAYHSDGGLHVAPADGTQTGRALVVGEADVVTWGLSDFVHAEELGRLRSFWWAPDSSSLLVARVDESPVAPVYIADPANPDSEPTAVRYPFAGADNPATRLWHVTLDGSLDEVAWNHTELEYLVDVLWTRGHPALVTVLDRRQHTMQVLEWTPGDAPAPRRVITDDAWVDVVPGVPAWWGERVLTVERDVETDTFRLMADGEAVTPIGVQVSAVLSVEEQWVLLSVWEDECEQRAARLGADESWEFVTAAAAVASAKGAGGTIVTRVDSLEAVAPVVSVSRDGRRLEVGSDVVEPALRPAPVRLRRTQPDDPRAVVLLPSDHDGLPLPVLLDPYGGPHGQKVVNAARAYLESQWWAEQGYAVVVADGPGTPGPPSWQRAMDGDFAGVALAAQVRALEMLADQVGAVADVSRVAIRGWSFGGYLAALAVLERPDVVHAGIAGAPVTDFALYDTAYTERYLHRPADHLGRYEAQSLLPRAEKLARPLLIIHGLADDNVLVANSLRLSSALLAAGRRHQVLPLSGVTHMTPQEVVAENLLLAQRDFLAEALAPAGP
jgi:dipeptidyl-peptidase-4